MPTQPSPWQRREAAAAAAAPAPPRERGVLAVALLVLLAAVVAPLLAGIPDEEVWTPRIDALGLLAGAWLLAAGRSPVAGGERGAARWTWAALALLPLAAAASLLWRWAGVDHGAATYVDAMLRGVAYWGALASLAAGAWWAASRRRFAGYLMLVALAAAAAVAAAIGVQDYMVSVLRNHIHDWREFGTSTPDYYAGYLLITLPATLGLFLAAPGGEGRRIGWLYGFAVLLQLAALLSTGSRFALVSLAVALVVLTVGLWRARAARASLGASLRRKLIGLAVIAALGLAAFAGPVAHRLQSGTLRAQANSGAFRVYTWRGALRLAARAPALGAGPNLFVYAYPRYALVGFTRVAHSGYLQTLDDLGALGLLATAAILAGGLYATWRGAAAMDDGDGASAGAGFLSQVAPAPAGDAVVVAGLQSGVVAALAQNVIDSDWSITLCGVTLFVALGLALGLGARRGDAPAAAGSAPAPRALRVAGIAAALPALLLALQGLVWGGAGAAAQAGLYDAALQAAPLDGEYWSDDAWRDNLPQGDLAGAAQRLATATALSPSSVNYYRRASVAGRAGDAAGALASVRAGLALDPHSLELLLLGASLGRAGGDPALAESYDQRAADDQVAPYGTVLAITGIVQYRYAYADYDVAAFLIGQGRVADALPYLRRGEGVLEEYAAEGGSRNSMRAATLGSFNGQAGSAGAQIDADLQTLYGQTMTLLARARQRLGRGGDAAATRAKAARIAPTFVAPMAPPAGSAAPPPAGVPSG